MRRRRFGEAVGRRRSHRHQRALGFLQERQAEFATVPINRNHVAQRHLFRRQQTRQRINHVPLDRALQVPRAIFHVRAFFQQKVPRRLRYAEQESSLCRLQHALLHHPQLDFQNLFQLCRTQRMEHHGLVNAVHEFRREFPLGGFRSSLLYFLVEPYLGLRALQRRKSQPAGHQLGDFHAAQVRGHENHRLRQIHSPVVAQRQSSLVQNPQQQLPQGIRSLLDLVKQQERNLQLLGAPNSPEATQSISRFRASAEIPRNPP